jgi:hypothetical protein
LRAATTALLHDLQGELRRRPLWARFPSTDLDSPPGREGRDKGCTCEGGIGRRCAPTDDARRKEGRTGAQNGGADEAGGFESVDEAAVEKKMGRQTKKMRRGGEREGEMMNKIK